MKKQGIYQTDLGIGSGWIHFGSKDGEPFSQLSFIDIGDMNNDCIKTELDGDQIIITVMLNDMPSSIQIDTETEKGVFDVFSIGFHKELELQLISDIPAFDNHHIVVPEKNIHELQAHQDYISEQVENKLQFTLSDPEVLSYAKKHGIDVENHHDIKSCLEIMDKLCYTIQQDGVNYTHDKQNCGTIAQMEYAFQHNHHTNCRGLALILAGILRAYGYRASAVECRPLSGDVHVVCEVYLEDLKKWVMMDPTNDLVYYQNTTPLSLIELREAMINHAELSLNENANRNGKELDIMSLLAFMSNKMFYFVKTIDSCEDKTITNDNAICLTSKELMNEECEWKITTNNVAAYYQKLF